MAGSHGPDGGIAKRVFEIVPGVWWPSADEHGLRAVAAAWHAAADATDSVAGTATATVQSVTTANTGAEFVKLAAFWGRMDTGAGAGHLPEAAKACRQIADACERLADQIEEAKHRVIVELTIVAAVIVASVATCWIPVVGQIGAAGAAMTAAALVTATGAIGITLSAVAASIAASVIVGAVMGSLIAITVDMVVAQPIRMAFGDQEWGHWNAEEVLAYAKGGAIGGGLAGGLAGVGQLAGVMSESMAASAPALAKGVGMVPRALTSSVGEVLAGTGINAATGYVLNGEVTGLDIVTGAAGSIGGRLAGPGAERGPLLDQVGPLADPEGALGRAADGGLRARLAGLGRLGELINAEGALPPLPDGWQADTLLRPGDGDRHGGDILVSKLSPDGRILDVSLADITGHGTKAAPDALALADSIDRLLAATPGNDDFLAQANQHVYGMNEANGSFTIPPATHLSLDLATGDFAMHDAGFTAGSHYRAETGTWEPLKPAGRTTMLGLFPDNAGAPLIGNMAPGDAVLLYSDGLVETRARSIEEGIIGLQEIAEPLVLEGHPAPAEIIAERLRALGQGLDDDLSLFYIRRPVPGENPPASDHGCHERVAAIDWADQAGQDGSNFHPPKGYPTVVHDFERQIRPSGRLRPSSQTDTHRQLLNSDTGRGIVYLHNGGRGELWNAANFDGVPRLFRGRQEAFWTQDIATAVPSPRARSTR